MIPRREEKHLAISIFDGVDKSRGSFVINSWEGFGLILEHMFKTGFILEAVQDEFCWTNGLIYVHFGGQFCDKDERVYNAIEFRDMTIRKAAEAKNKLTAYNNRETNND